MKILFLLLTVMAADQKKLVPLSSLVFQPQGVAIDTDGKVYADAALWKQYPKDGGKALYVGTGDSMKYYRVAVSPTTIATTVANPDQLMPPDASAAEEWKTGVLLKWGLSSDKQSTSLPYLSLIRLSEDRQILSQTQCLTGQCVTVTPKACASLLRHSGEKSLVNLQRKFDECRDLSAAWVKTFNDPTVEHDLNDAFKQDYAKYKNESPLSPASSEYNKLNRVLLGDKKDAKDAHLQPEDQYERAQLATNKALQLKRLYVDTCAQHFAQALPMAGAGQTDGTGGRK